MEGGGRKKWLCIGLVHTSENVCAAFSFTRPTRVVSTLNLDAGVSLVAASCVVRGSAAIVLVSNDLESIQPNALGQGGELQAGKWIYDLNRVNNNVFFKKTSTFQGEAKNLLLW